MFQGLRSENETQKIQRNQKRGFRRKTANWEVEKLCVRNSHRQKEKGENCAVDDWLCSNLHCRSSSSLIHHVCFTIDCTICCIIQWKIGRSREIVTILTRRTYSRGTRSGA
ncbi:hypothetical protein I7I53_03242 [Histoplasma capsulatum var. duboisii H88]|uniref:Uncharacterized protein n=1 Tax=Ajellomyces capsulatus (strain H88) TaxID=544711 RepID=A0A8A1LPQ5_AJEC8|nr:hypothetical protein I7I53_03242 [Histoplasma capsulatum var. duboisii H88]